ncbi:MAG: superoxide dismutase family protein [Lachnospiraceae bacterium]|nr:superoxide dismutase family protein [Lachnospiraceae bacterium]
MYHNQPTPRTSFTRLLLYEYPMATAWVRGNYQNPQLSGLVKFYQTPYEGVLIEAEFFGLPNISEKNSSDFYAMHIHESGDCSDNFTKTGDHYNPTAEPHPYHAGDLLPLLGNQGYAFSTFYDKRFTIDDVIGKSVVIHAGRDDFSTQPSGNAGAKIACGEIRQGL